ncbi:MAG TPA: alpha/beta fold hydrolase [Elusimicrobiota bacterium]|nr:alpha/beta fold hydrolase [Elusimicrobiota bacterium]
MINILALSLAVAAAAAPAPKSFAAKTDERLVSFPTKDGWTISALYRPAKRHGDVLILAHGVGSAKVEWAGFTQRLAAKGVGTLAIDLRGHADSKKGPKNAGDYTTFDETGEWPLAVADLDAAVEWLKAQGVPEDKIALGGASIGANLASAEAAARPKTPFLLLLSAGPDYRGVRLRKPQTRTLAVASPPDQGADMTLKPLGAVPGVETFEAPAGHGVQMFADPAALDKVVDWVVAAAKRKR